MIDCNRANYRLRLLIQGRLRVLTRCFRNLRGNTMKRSQSLWSVDTQFNTVPGVTKASIRLNEPRAPQDGIPITLLAQHQHSINAAWMLRHHELVVCTKVVDGHGKSMFAYDHYSTTDAKGFYFSEVRTILDTYLQTVS